MIDGEHYAPVVRDAIAAVPYEVVAAVLGGEGARLSDEELDRIAELVDKAKKEGSR